MTVSLSLKSRASPQRLLRGMGASAVTLALFAGQVTPAFATIDNTATANGTPTGGTLTPPTATVNVPVAAPTPKLTVVKTVAAPVETGTDGVINAGDTITYTYVVKNDNVGGSNVTINNAKPVDTGPTFNGIAGTGAALVFSPVSANLTPGQSQTFTATYTLTALDAYRAAGILAATGNAVENSATATGTPVVGTLGAVTASTAETQIPANPKLSILKTHAFTTDTGTLASADVGDVIKYTYTITNTGNVTINNASISDNHEGTVLSGQPLGEAMAALADGPMASALPAVVSSDAVANNGVWSVLRPGATITFTYNHTVTQTEFNNQ
jgi:hypothetical protein